MLLADARSLEAARAFAPVAIAPAPSRRLGPGLLFLGMFGLYIVLAGLLTFRGQFIHGDSWSRVGNAAWMLLSRDPHLAAVGFVWNPLPSMVELPLVALSGLWRPLITDGFAGNIASALFMAGTVVVLAEIARDLRVPRAWAVLVVALFALNPMILLYAANGLSEAAFLFFLVLASRSLIAWWRTDATASLAMAGCALALAYLTRYEALAAAGFVIAIVFARGLGRHAGTLRARMPWGFADALVAATPVAAAFMIWAAASLVITGNPFETFSSIYGNSSQVALQGQAIAAITGHGLDALRYGAAEVTGLSPLIGPLVALAAVMTFVRRRSLDFLVPLALFGGVLAFEVAATVSGSSFAWLRFAIAVIPLTAILGLLALGTHSSISTADAASLAQVVPPVPDEQDQSATADPAPGERPAARRSPPSRRSAAGSAAHRAGRSAVAFALGGAVVAALAISAVGSYGAMTNPRFGREEGVQVAAMLNGADPNRDVTQAAIAAQSAATYIDALGLPDGSVVADVSTAFPVVLQSTHPRQFVITPDRDFQQILLAPRTFGANYLLLPSTQGYNSLDAVSRAYPLLAVGETDGSATLVETFGTGTYAWRLFRVER